MALQPVGPLPASTYWRRRVLVGVVGVVVLLVVVKSCGGSDSTGALAVPTPTARHSPAATAPSPVASPSPSPTAPAAIGPCRNATLEITAESDAVTYPSGAAPKFTLTVRNSGSVPCRRALGPGAVELRVFSGEDRIWSSDDCNESKEQGVQTLPSGAARATTVQWSGKRTKPGCDTGAAAQAGTYRVSARVGDLVRQGSVFRFTG